VRETRPIAAAGTRKMRRFRTKRIAVMSGSNDADAST
jgi:hypothetical protein